MPRFGWSGPAFYYMFEYLVILGLVGGPYQASMAFGSWRLVKGQVELRILIVSIPSENRFWLLLAQPFRSPAGFTTASRACCRNRRPVCGDNSARPPRSVPSQRSAEARVLGSPPPERGYESHACQATHLPWICLCGSLTVYLFCFCTRNTEVELTQHDSTFSHCLMYRSTYRSTRMLFSAKLVV